jgi:hypothetical protein
MVNRPCTEPHCAPPHRPSSLLVFSFVAAALSILASRASTVSTHRCANRDRRGWLRGLPFPACHGLSEFPLSGHEWHCQWQTGSIFWGLQSKDSGARPLGLGNLELVKSYKQSPVLQRGASIRQDHLSPRGRAGDSHPGWEAPLKVRRLGVQGIQRQLRDRGLPRGRGCTGVLGESREDDRCGPSFSS